MRSKGCAVSQRSRDCLLRGSSEFVCYQTSSTTSTIHGGHAAAAVAKDTSRDAALDANGRLTGLTSMRKPLALRMWIPDTIVYGETGQAIWIYSDKDGFVQRLTGFGEKQVLEKLGSAMMETERAQRQVCKLVRCKCYDQRTLVRIRARLPPEKNYALLCASLNESPDASLAYESWSVCGFCYAIYERDQQLKHIEIKFSAVLGVPNPANALDGLSSIQGGTYALDPNSMGSTLPPQLTLCRLVLVFNAIYDIPKELCDAEQAHFEHLPVGARKNKTLRAIASKLYLRITALGYTECVALHAEDIEVAQNRAPRGAATLRKASTLSDFEFDEAGEQRADDDNTSGIAPLLNGENSILVHFIRATEPPLHDPTTIKIERTKKKRRAALIPEAAAISDMVSEMQMPHHSVLLGSTRIRLAQFRSAYVTKIDFYACMALSGELFNIKGNIDLERLRYVDTKFLTSQYRLRMFNGVFIPDDSYTTNDPLSPEWMDSLRISSRKQTRTPGGFAPNEDVDDREEGSDVSETTTRGARYSRSSLSPQSRQRLSQSRQVMTKSTASLLTTDNEEMDEELEHMIDLVDLDQQHAFRRRLLGDPPSLCIIVKFATMMTNKIRLRSTPRMVMRIMRPAIRRRLTSQPLEPN
ncbi:hypothetical protein FI667_g1744, partial [Globisporangium splendens]